MPACCDAVADRRTGTLCRRCDDWTRHPSDEGHFETILQLVENATDISLAVREQNVVSKTIAEQASSAAAMTRSSFRNGRKSGQIATDVLNAGEALATCSGRLRAEVGRFLAQVRVA